MTLHYSVSHISRYNSFQAQNERTLCRPRVMRRTENQDKQCKLLWTSHSRWQDEPGKSTTGAFWTLYYERVVAPEGENAGGFSARAKFCWFPENCWFIEESISQQNVAKRAGKEPH